MHLNTYQQLASCTQPAPGVNHFFNSPPLPFSATFPTAEENTRVAIHHRNVDLIHAVLGLFSEGGELAGTVKAMFAYGKFKDEEIYTKEARANMIIEAGDKLWYIALICRGLGVTLEEVAAANITKLRARYPDGYTDLAAVSRADTERPEVDYCPELDKELDDADRTTKALIEHVVIMGAASMNQTCLASNGRKYRVMVELLPEEDTATATLPGL
jgi:NTP pyrophosphatase (non-canonical NTP hydrolase)